MTPDLVKALIRYCIEDLLGTSAARRASKRMQVLLSNDSSGPLPAQGGWPPCFVTYWILVKAPKSPAAIVLREVRGVVLAHATGGSYGNLPIPLIGKIASIQTTASTFAGAGNVVSAATPGGRAQMVGGIVGQLNEAWASGTWASACESRQAFSLGMDHMLAGGSAAIVSEGVDDYFIQFRVMADRQHLISQMSASERKGRFDDRSRLHVRDNCTQHAFRVSLRENTIRQVEPRFGVELPGV